MAEVNALQAGHVTPNALTGIINEAFRSNAELLRRGRGSDGGATQDQQEGSQLQQSQAQIFTWDDGTVSPLPGDWKFPTEVRFRQGALQCLPLKFSSLFLPALNFSKEADISRIWVCWFVGFNGSPPLRMLQPAQVPGTGRNTLSKLKWLMGLVEAEVKRVEGAWVENPTSLQAATMFAKVEAKFFLPRPRGPTLSWTTFVNHWRNKLKDEGEEEDDGGVEERKSSGTEPPAAGAKRPRLS
jgi:hypothetical protein